jgi:hypothetical protein
MAIATACHIHILKVKKNRYRFLSLPCGPARSGRNISDCTKEVQCYLLCRADVRHNHCPFQHSSSKPPAVQFLERLREMDMHLTQAEMDAKPATALIEASSHVYIRHERGGGAFHSTLALTRCWPAKPNLSSSSSNLAFLA